MSKPKTHEDLIGDFKKKEALYHSDRTSGPNDERILLDFTDIERLEKQWCCQCSLKLKGVDSNCPLTVWKQRKTRAFFEKSRLKYDSGYGLICLVFDRVRTKLKRVKVHPKQAKLL